MNVEKASSFAIYVDANSPAIPGQENGESWQSAFKNLQPAIDKAMVDGKEIWIAEGVYHPTYRINPDDPRSATFLIKPGVELIGGFKGTEIQAEPKGSPYNTILSGDLAANDDSISVWPPAESDSVYLRDNVYHVATIEGNEGARGIKIENVTITGGVANGSGEKSTGAGILNKSASPTLIFTVIKRNIADSSGAGIMDKAGIKSLVNCLFEENISLKGNGAGLHTSGAIFKIDASVFDGNRVQDTTVNAGGGAIYAQNSEIEMVNCVLAHNRSGSKGGAVLNSNGKFSVINSTFAANWAQNEAQSIWNKEATATIVNTIMWNDYGKSETGGEGFDITYSCVTGGFAGEGNIDQNPHFANINHPKGSDQKYGTQHDGLQLLSVSSCIDAAIDSSAPLVDIAFNSRPQFSGFDMGAYEYNTYLSQDGVFGIIEDGEFVSKSNLSILPYIDDKESILLHSISNAARILRIAVPKNKYTNSRTRGHLYLRWVSICGNYLEGSVPVKIDMLKVDEDSNNLYFQSISIDNKPKYILFVNHSEFQNINSKWAYVVYAENEGHVEITVPYSQ